MRFDDDGDLSEFGDYCREHDPLRVGADVPPAGADGWGNDTD
jgi:hypothetical protein